MNGGDVGAGLVPACGFGQGQALRLQMACDGQGQDLRLQMARDAQGQDLRLQMARDAHITARDAQIEGVHRQTDASSPQVAVKICGIRRPADAVVAAESGADFLGLMFWEGSRRRVTEDQARAILDAVRGRVKVVGVFVNEAPAEMNRLARDLGLDYVQLSGDEPDTIVSVLDVPAIQVIHVRGPVAAERIDGCPADLVMLDAGRRGSYGGTGQAFDWSLAPAVERRVFLAGGLHAGNVGEAVARVRPWGVDVSSGVEMAGEKDPALIREFIRVVRG